MRTDSFVLQANGIVKNFYEPVKTPILQGVDLLVKQGESVAIMGRSGEGKSTLLQILGTLEEPCAGALSIGGEKVSFFNKNRLRNRRLAFIFQNFHLLEDYTALENILMPKRIARQATKPGSAAFRQAMDLMEQAGIASRAHFVAKLLSGGEKQRVAIARALSNDPDLLLADEPSGNLDKQTAEGIHQLLLQAVKERNKSLIVVTHDPALARLCDSVYLLRQGRLEHYSP